MGEIIQQVQQVPEYLKKLVGAQVSRLQTINDEAAKLEGKLLENATLVVDKSATQVKSGLTKVVDLTAQARRRSLEAAQKFASSLQPRA